MSISESLDFIRIDHPSRKPFVAGIGSPQFKTAKPKYYLTKEGKVTKTNSEMAFEVGADPEVLRVKRFNKGMKIFHEFGIVEFQTKKVMEKETRTLEELLSKVVLPKKNIPIIVTGDGKTYKLPSVMETSRFLKISKERVRWAINHSGSIKLDGITWRLVAVK